MENVVFQGTEGSYSHIAARRHFAARQIRLSGRDTFREAAAALASGDADLAFLPIENTTAGSIHEVYDLVTRHGFHLVGEEVQMIEHCLLAVADVAPTSIRRVLSQAQALAQCTEFIAQLQGCHAEAFADTALAARKVRDDGDPAQAAIASEEAGRLYGLRVLARDIANQRHNYTRFIVAARAPEAADPGGACKTSLVFATRNAPGALVACLQVFARHGLNLTKLESRPLPERPWEYLFYVDLEGHAARPAETAALRELEPHTTHLRVLGSYRAAL